MNNLFSNFDHAIVERVGWTLLHSLWQVAVVAGLVAILHAVLAKRSARVRYVIACAGMTACLMTSCVTFFMIETSGRSDPAIAVLPAELREIAASNKRLTETPRADSMESVFLFPQEESANSNIVTEKDSRPLPREGSNQVQPSQEFSIEVPQENVTTDSQEPKTSAPILTSVATKLRPWLATLVCIWLIGVFVLSIRPLLGLHRSRKLKTRGLSTVPRFLSRIASDACEHMRLRNAVEIAQSTLVEVPCVIGFFKPMVLLPASALTGLNEAQLRAIVVHELAHIRRHDYLMNLFQRVIESLLFYHPLVWWLSSQIRAERENCCDDIVLKHCSDRVLYVRALMQLETDRDNTGLLALNATGGSLVKRVRRIAGKQAARSGNAWIAGLIVLSLLAVIPLVQFAWQTAQPSQDSSANSASELDEQNENTEAIAMTGARMIRVHVVQANGEVVENAKVVRHVRNKTDRYDPFRTNDEGVAEFAIPDETPRMLAIYASDGNFTPMKAVWLNTDPNARNPIPTEVTFNVRTGNKISGRVIDQANKPVPDATIKIFGYRGKFKNEGISQAWENVELTTDGDGRWSFDRIPVEKPIVWGTITHPDFVDESFTFDGDHKHYKIGLMSALAGEHSITLKPGMSVRGKVTNALGSPLANTKVVLGKLFFSPSPRSTLTDSMGRYEFQHVKESPFQLVVANKDYAPQLRRVDDFASDKPVNFKLKKGRKISFLVVDENDQPISDAKVVYDEWLNARTLQNCGDVLPQKTDTSGKLVWENAPDELVSYSISSPNRISISFLNLEARDEPHKIVMHRPLSITGKVTYQDSGLPVENFSVLRGFSAGGDQIHWHRREPKKCNNGDYYFRINESRDAHFIRIESEGCKPAVSKSFVNSDGEVKSDFQLVRDKGIRGTVVDSDGKLVAGATVCYSLPHHAPYLRNNAELHEGNRALIKTKSDDRGQFEFPAQDQAWAILVNSDDGYAYLSQSEFEKADGKIAIAPWSAIRGKCMIGDKPAAGERVKLSFDREPVDSGRLYFTKDYSALVETDGSFELTRIPPGSTGTVARQFLKWEQTTTSQTGETHGQKFAVKAGQTLKVNIGGTGRPVAGRLKLPDSDDREVRNWNYGTIMLVRTGGREGILQPNETGKFSFRINPDGRFRVEDVPEGKYLLNLRVNKPGDSQRKTGTLIGIVNETFIIPKWTMAAATIHLNLAH